MFAQCFELSRINKGGLVKLNIESSGLYADIKRFSYVAYSDFNAKKHSKSVPKIMRCFIIKLKET
ncbi:hypothetical protein BCT90_04345 [Vibrio lentus]|nr:hypothetical protein BCT90_04345 [Vibrio lentus]